MKKIRMLEKMKAKRLAAELVVSWIGEAWHDLDCPYYAKMPANEKEMIKYYIHRYGIIIGWVLRRRYEPHG